MPKEEQNPIDQLTPEEAMSLPQDLKRAYVKRQLAKSPATRIAGAVGGRSPLGLAARLATRGVVVGAKALNPAEKAAADIRGEIEDGVDAITGRLAAAAGQIMRGRRVRVTNDKRFDARVEEAKAAERDLPTQSALDVVKEFILPGSEFAKSKVDRAAKRDKKQKKKEERTFAQGRDNFSRMSESDESFFSPKFNFSNMQKLKEDGEL